jgi:hypothetical protein
MLIFLGGSAITILAALWWFKSEWKNVNKRNKC